MVAVCGYYVQGSLKAKERQREMVDAQRERAVQMRLETLRKKISIFVGPCVQHLLNLQTTINYLFPPLRTARNKKSCQRNDKQYTHQHLFVHERTSTAPTTEGQRNKNLKKDAQRFISPTGS